MIYINDQKGYVSKVEEKNGMIFATVSTSKKDKRTDEWVKSYWTFKFTNGKPHDGKINIISGGIEKNKGKDGKYYENFTAFKWEQDEQEFKPEDESQVKPEIPEGFAALEDDDDIPF